MYALACNLVLKQLLQVWNKLLLLLLLLLLLEIY